MFLLLNSFSEEYSHLKSLYNTQRESWSVNELISICVQEGEDKAKRGKAVAVNYISKPKYKDRKRQFGKRNFGNKDGASRSGTKHDIFKEKPHKPNGPLKCFFCKKSGHFKKDCEGFKIWLNKKGNFLLKTVFSLGSHAYNDKNSWWFDTGSPSHVVNSMHGLFSTQTIPKNETKVCTANGQRTDVHLNF